MRRVTVVPAVPLGVTVVLSVTVLLPAARSVLTRGDNTHRIVRAPAAPKVIGFGVQARITFGLRFLASSDFAAVRASVTVPTWAILPGPVTVTRVEIT